MVVLLLLSKAKLFLQCILEHKVHKETLKNGKERVTISKINKHSILFLEEEIDKMDEKLPQMTHFILPGGHQTVSFCHIARCVCRRAERLSVELNEKEKVSNELIIYLNRLSDYLFTLARKLSKELLVDEIKWIPEKKS